MTCRVTDGSYCLEESEVWVIKLSEIMRPERQSVETEVTLSNKPRKKWGTVDGRKNGKRRQCPALSGKGETNPGVLSLTRKILGPQSLLNNCKAEGYCKE